MTDWPRFFVSCGRTVFFSAICGLGRNFGGIFMAYMRLGDLLRASGVITQEQLDKALKIQKETRQRLGDVLVQNGFITEQHLIEALQIQLGVEFVDLTSISIPVELAKFVPRNIAKKFCVVPVKLVKDTLYLAMSDPLDFVAQEEVKAASKKRVIPMIATRRATEQAIARLYGNEGTARVIEEMKREAGSAAQDIVPAQMAQEVADAGDSAPTIRFVNSLIERAAAERASDIHLEPQEGEMAVRMRIDGLLHRILTVPAELQSTVISRLKIMGGMNIAEHKIPQDGQASVQIKGHALDLRISSMPTVYGEKIVLRLLDKSAQGLTKEAIGLEGRDLELYDALLKNTSGVILLVGPTGSGKSTTLCAMIRDLAREEVNVVTLEDPVEYHIPGVSQCQINEKTGMTFASGLRAILRQDPDIISVGEIRDGETASIAMRSAITGHLTYKRRTLRGVPPARHRRGAVAHRERTARRDLPAPCAQNLPPLQNGLSARGGGAGPAGPAGGDADHLLQGHRLPGMPPHGLSRPPRGVRNSDGERQGAPPHHGGRGPRRADRRRAVRGLYRNARELPPARGARRYHGGGSRTHHQLHGGRLRNYFSKKGR